MTVVSEGRDSPLPVVVVDLDGTLIQGDLLWESLWLLLKRFPKDFFLFAPLWLLQGKASFKNQLARRVVPKAENLAYRPEVLEYLAAAKARGQRIVLASASPHEWVQPVADHLHFFDETLSSTESINLAGAEKLKAVEALLGQAPFTYLGNSKADLPIWDKAHCATSVSPSRSALRGLAAHAQHQPLPVAAASPIKTALKAVRPHQWIKNALLFVPISLAHQLADVSRLLPTLAIFIAFCAVASAGYILNDLMDVEDDRQHPTKRKRPIASGQLAMPTAVLYLVALLASAAALSTLALSPAARAMVAGYFLLTVTYSFYFKEQLIADVFILAGLYTYRVLAGGVASGVEVSPWLLAFSTFFFVSLALVKRYTELLSQSKSDSRTTSRRAYAVGDLPLIETMGVASATIAILVLCLFVSSESVTLHYARPLWLWMIPPLMYYWITRIWMIAHRGELDADPVLFAAKDRMSLATGVILAAIVWSAAA